MTKYLMIIGIVATIFITTSLVKNIHNKKAKLLILIGPFVLAGILYIGIMLLTVNMPPDACDGGALLGMLIVFILLGMGILFNLINILHMVLTRNR